LKKEVLLALMASLIEDSIRNNSVQGPRGIKGREGKDFNFEDHQDKIYSSIQSYIEQIKDSLKIPGKDGVDGKNGTDGKTPTKEEILDCLSSFKDDLKLKFSDLSDSEILSLKGDKGEKGLSGRTPGKEEILLALEEIKSELKLKFSDLTEIDKDSLKLKFESLTEEEKFSLRGGRGQKGKQGDGFRYEDHADKFSELLTKIFESNKDGLKLKFSDLSEDEKSLLKYLPTPEEKESFKLKFSDLTEEEKISLRGSRGQKGKQGASIVGEKGENFLHGDGFPHVGGRVGDKYLDITTGDLYVFE
jgi:hypothetical protein